ncbi:MAG: MoxR family ATPase [Bryobacteraceae bacterium]
MDWLNADWFRDLENKEKKRPSAPVDLPPPRRRDWADPAGYLPDQGLADAIRVALVLRKPLLVTGEPGTGKTECAAYLAWKLGRPKPLVFDAKSTSAARDLFYTFDTLGRFQAMHADKTERNALDFLRWNALGDAILQTREPAYVEGLRAPDWAHHGPAESVVLIDEIDKAPRDFPNDLLSEIDRMYFRVPELNNRLVEAASGRHPVVVITSNSEKNLPPAFLRRCVYYDIPFPEKRLEEIVAARLPEAAVAGSRVLKDAIAFFLHLRNDDTGLSKKPATAELLDWLLYLMQRGAKPALPLREQDGLVTPSLVALLKNKEDQDQREDLWNNWKP